MTTEGLSLPRISVGDPGAGAVTRVRGARTSSRFANIEWSALMNYAVVTVAGVLAVLDVWLHIPSQAPTYSIYLSGAACLALTASRRFPFLALIGTIPGFLAGWSELAPMIALGVLAVRQQTRWQTWVGATLVFTGRFVQWPLTDFVQLDWRDHVLDAIYGVLVAGMPIAIALLIGARTELAEKLTELAAGRDRERLINADVARAEERTRLAREMHDVVSHQITLIAMQAGALQVQTTDARTQQTAQVIRQLSTKTLEELRSLVSVLRSGPGDDARHGLDELDQLVRTSAVPVHLTVERIPADLPSQVSAAAYRVVQECLTNMHKHAPGATATIRVQGEYNALKVEVRNDRAGARCGSDLPSGGNGLTGLAERARLLGGSFETCPTADGGFRVRARFPLDRQPADTVAI
ncbi:sensor histidine kinase [Amycolatopsis sp. H20-H5]|uniref:sensor histidine kinase n=1 Tax=Amycolatopsis sp. H20-H5 TaxID=3046309 RepID=UPI002DB5E997|nr:sensor histidine kinase [Amycolatopsis sp. H20-H5]MEC3981942.1 sensor histidine kinase [Amycolatopsis sp. H20-H5]